MSGIAELIANSLMAQSPSNGGLSATNYPNPYGLRAYKMHDGNYGGQMMPKGQGWRGVQAMPDGGVMTEFSVGDEAGDFPLIVPQSTQSDIARMMQAEMMRQSIPRDLMTKARSFAEQRRSQGLSPFKDLME